MSTDPAPTKSSGGLTSRKGIVVIDAERWLPMRDEMADFTAIPQIGEGGSGLATDNDPEPDVMMARRGWAVVAAQSEVS